MFRFLKKKLEYSLLGNVPENKEATERQGSKSESDDCENYQLQKELETNLTNFKKCIGDSADVKTHQFSFGPNNEYKGALFFIDGLVNGDRISETIVKPLIFGKIEDSLLQPDSMVAVRQSMLLSPDAQESNDFVELVNGCLSGDTVLLIDGIAEGLIISTRGWEKRGISEPQSESVIRGPREGFTESLRTNTALIRRKIKSPDLRMESFVLGERTKTDVCIVYLKGVADPEVIETLRYRLDSIDLDSVLDSGSVEQYIEDKPFSIFATIAYTEKPDVGAANILEGRVGILVDGSPSMLTVPMLFVESFQTSEDYYIRTIYASVLRMLRYLAFFFAVFAPAIYIALTTFHQELIPTTLLITIAQAREGTPFNAVLEAYILILAFEILREAGLRLPRPVGQAVSIVGALIMGDAAVSAGIVGAPMVITVALTSVAGFVVPAQSDAISIMRVIMTGLGAFLGGYGLAIGFLAMCVHLATLHSFGVPYLSGIAPAQLQSAKDVFIRAPLWSMLRRPQDIARHDMVRRKFMIPPAKMPSDRMGDSKGGTEQT